MRLAFFSPLPPAKSGIADYSAALLDSLTRHAAIDVYTRPEPDFDPAGLDGVLYQLGNNPFHSFVYEQALKTPGIVVMHEANLHHLIADITIRRGDWDAYLREVEYDGGAAALAFAQRVRRLEAGPDYEGVPMLRRVLERSRGAIAHSRFVAGQLRAAGYRGPVAVIPHGAWLPNAEQAGREKLGIGQETPLIGIFGFLKPYKRIPESLRAFRRLLQVYPDARMLLAGEIHPDLPLQSMISSLGIGAGVRVTGFADIGDFVGAIAAADIVLNLRYPTVGETSGTLLRALGLGKAVLVSDVGAFAEYPDEVCLKVPVDHAEEDTILEYLKLLVSRSDLRESLGRKAREWVARECSWDIVAGKYIDFVKAVRDGNASVEMPAVAAAEVAVAAEAVDALPSDAAVHAHEYADYIRGWAKEDWALEYVEDHITRLVHTLEITPPGGPGKRALEMGAYLQITAALKTKLGYEEVRGCYYGPAGKTQERHAVSSSGETFSCTVELFNAENDPFPYPDGWFDTVLCCELIEHLPTDPMHLMMEINRILKPGGHLVLTTPNAASLRAISAILQGYHPGFFPAYIKPKRPGEETDPRHAREYAPREIAQLLQDGGFEVELLETGEFREVPHPEQLWVEALLETHELATELRGDGIYAVGRKTGAPVERYPDWLYVG